MAATIESSKSQIISFTLPISCQICLGKVKQPVICPNQHVFCGSCMDHWLKKSPQCPACRVIITSTNPCRQIIGGLNHAENNEDNFSKKEIRRSRMAMLVKDYEDELDRVYAEVAVLKCDKETLQKELRQFDKPGAVNPISTVTTQDTPLSNMDVKVLTVMREKLNNATNHCEKLKKDTHSLKKNLGEKTDECIQLSRENEKLRMDLTNRSPRRFGRFTVATLENKVDENVKEIRQLERALERSDSYIEDIEKELEMHRSNMKLKYPCPKCQLKISLSDVVKSNSAPQASKSINNTCSTSKLFQDKTTGNANEKFPETEKSLLRRSPRKSSQSVTTPRPQPNMTHHTRRAQPTDAESSFCLEMPSPMTPTSSISRLSISKSSITSHTTSGLDMSQLTAQDDSMLLNNTQNDSLFNSTAGSTKAKDDSLFDNNSTLDNMDSNEAMLNSCRKKLRFDFSEQSSKSSMSEQRPPRASSTVSDSSQVIPISHSGTNPNSQVVDNNVLSHSTNLKHHTLSNASSKLFDNSVFDNANLRVPSNVYHSSIPPSTNSGFKLSSDNPLIVQFEDTTGHTDGHNGEPLIQLSDEMPHTSEQPSALITQDHVPDYDPQHPSYNHNYTDHIKSSSSSGPTHMYNVSTPVNHDQESDVHNMSMTPEIEDCMKILNEAEKKVSQRKCSEKASSNAQKLVAYDSATAEH